MSGVCVCVSHLALLSLCAQNLSGGGALPQEESECVFLQTHVPDGPRRLPRLLTRVYKHQHLHTHTREELLRPLYSCGYIMLAE